jgi:predicted secreted Zn-dependent protease
MFSRSVVCWFVASALVTLATAAEPALSKPIVRTRYQYFTVSGIDASALHRSLVQQGPTVNGDKAYAATEVAGGQDGSLVSGAAGCRIANYHMKLEFTMRLPKLRADVSLSPAVRSRWQSFESFVRKHEGVHRDIWIGCASEVEQAVRAINARSCEAAQAMATGILNQMWKQCARKHDAFDAAQRHPLMRQPFIIAANAAPQPLDHGGSRVRAAKVVRARGW